MRNPPKYFLADAFGRHLVSGFFFEYDEALQIGLQKFKKFRLNVTYNDHTELLYTTFEADKYKLENPVKADKIRYDNDLVIEHFDVNRISHTCFVKNYFPHSGTFLIEFEKPISYYYSKFLEKENFNIESLNNFTIKIKPLNLNFYKSCKRKKITA